MSQDETVENGIKRKEDGTFDVGTAPGPGRPPETEEQRITKKAIKVLVQEYKETLADVLPDLSPILKKKALTGDMVAIKEVHDRVMGKAEQHTDITTGGKPIVQLAQEIIDKNEIDTSTEPNSQE